MTLETDKIMDRRNMKRSLAWWRVLAIVSVVALMIMAIGRFDDLDGGDHIAALDVDNIIVDDPDRIELLKDIADDPEVRALLLNINSPGGTVVGGESLFLTLRDVAEKKPVVAVMRELATSAGYMIALGADHIVARQATITGSIGVLMQSTDVTGLLEKIGIKSEAVKSSPLKAQPNPLEPFTDDGREAAREIIADMQDMFVGLVRDRRKLDEAKVRQVTDGRIFTGRQALSNGLIDAIGGEDEAIDWLETEKGVHKNLPVVQIFVRKEGGRLRDLLEDVVGKTLISERLRLDGVISLWHPNLK